MRDAHYITVQTVRKLIREIEGMGLETSRMVVYEEIRALRIDPRLIDSVLRQVAEQRSQEGMVEVLQSFCHQLASHDTPAAPSRPLGSFLSLIAYVQGLIAKILVRKSGN